MRIKKPKVHEDIITDMLIRNGIKNFELERNHIVLNDLSSYNKKQIDCIKRNFKYFDIFQWSNRGIENILLWEQPDRIKDVVKEFNKAFSSKNYSIITSLEAKGFIIGGMFMSILKLPFLPIRKFKKLYDSLDGKRVDFTNWKNQKESLYLFDNDFKGKKAILIDDLLHTGNSLEAAVKLLNMFEINLVGAFYLADYSNKSIRNKFNFPIRSLVRYNDLLNNCY